MTNIYEKTIRKWIHKFNEMKIDGLFTKIDYSHTVKIDNDTRKEIVKIASTNPRDVGLKFSTWSLRSQRYNKRHSRQRVIVEHTICRIKKFGIMGSRYRNRLKRYDVMSDIVSGLVNYRIIHSSKKR